jgi:1-aminocyclopropane-1-carboxylate deaminase
VLPFLTAPLQLLHLDWLETAGIQVAVLRLDLIDPQISGNKAFKLVPYWQAAKAQGLHGLMSLGGAHSNHLHALAAMGQRLGLPTVGLLRGHEQPTPTVLDLQAMGMQLHWLGYGGYRQRHAPGFWAPWQARYAHLLAVPEGGSSALGAQGCAGLPALVEAQLAGLGWADFDAWWLAVGTGTTLAGLVLAEQGRRRVYGAMAVPAGHGVAETVAALTAEGRHYRLLDASDGGFGQVSPALLSFMAEVEKSSGLPLEPLYTAKALAALRDRAAAGDLRRGTRLVFVHTGGLQGRRGFGL